jgi:hypothetical protein
MTKCINNFVKINDSSFHTLAVLRIDKPLPLKWEVPYTKNEEEENEIMKGFKRLVKLGYREESER